MGNKKRKNFFNEEEKETIKEEKIEQFVAKDKKEKSKKQVQIKRVYEDSIKVM